jgi:hypothetical protein
MGSTQLEQTMVRGTTAGLTLTGAQAEVLRAHEEGCWLTRALLSIDFSTSSTRAQSGTSLLVELLGLADKRPLEERELALRGRLSANEGSTAGGGWSTWLPCIGPPAADPAWPATTVLAVACARRLATAEPMDSAERSCD